MPVLYFAFAFYLFTITKNTSLLISWCPHCYENKLVFGLECCIALFTVSFQLSSSDKFCFLFVFNSTGKLGNTFFCLFVSDLGISVHIHKAQGLYFPSLRKS